MGARKRKAPDEIQIRKWLDQTLTQFHRPEFLGSDPLELPHRFEHAEDRELIAVISALFAYGNVKSMKAAILTVVTPLGERPAEKLKSIDENEIGKIWAKAYYRFYSSKDIQALLRGLQKILKDHGSITNFFQASSEFPTREGSIFDWIQHFRNELLTSMPKKLTPGLKFMLADPHAGAAKRWHMLMRWMVRKDHIDLGIWSFIPRSSLVLPLDTHLFQIARALQLTKRKAASRQAALEVTEAFRRWDPEDPMKYDFALCRLGVLKVRDRELAALQKQFK